MFSGEHLTMKWSLRLTTAAATATATVNKNYYYYCCCYCYIMLLLLLLLLCTLICLHPIYEPQVPVANGSGSYPFSVDVPRNTRFLFSNKTVTPAKAIAKAIVRFLRYGLHFTLCMKWSPFGWFLRCWYKFYNFDGRCIY